MKSFIQILTVASISWSLAACSSGGSSGGSDNPSPQAASTVISESEHSADLINLNNTETGLEGSGLKFKTDFSFRNGVGTTSYSWDKTFMNAYLMNNPDVNIEDLIVPLENYINVVNQYLKKYAGQFQIKTDSGEVETKELLKSHRDELDAKVKLAKSTIESLQSAK